MKKIFVLLATIFISLNIMPVKAMEKTSDILKKNVVTSGEGLYVDQTINGRYIYKGGNPNNYIKLGNDLYRIISLEKDGTIKVIKNESIGSKAWDEGTARNDTGNQFGHEVFCNMAGHGCKAWVSDTTILDSNGNKVTQMSKEVNGTLYDLPGKEASLNTYLNNDWYNSLDKNIQDLIVTKDWNIGPTAYNQTNLSDSIKEESAYKWKGKIALMNATDYVKATTNNACVSLNDYYSNSSCLNNKASNYLDKSSDSWTLSPNSDLNSYFVLFVGSTSGLSSGSASYELGVLPVFYIASSTSIKGTGTEVNPYTIQEYKEEIKTDQPGNENKDEKDNNTKVDVVEVPSTSAFGSIVIAVLGIVCVLGSILITKKMTNNKQN